MTDTAKLLEAFTRHQSEAAFTDLVSRFIDLVYSVATRQVPGDTHLAQDITQKVFTDLASKAPTLSPDIQLGGWLHRHTCFVASTMRRSEARRRRRENHAATMNPGTAPHDEAWKELAPELDQAINRLSEPDRLAIVMRFFDERNLREIGSALKTSEDSAQKRVTRALHKLRSLLTQQGVALALPTLVTLLNQNCVGALPESLKTELTQTLRRKFKAAETRRDAPLPFTESPLLKMAAGIAVALLLATIFWPESETSRDQQSIGTSLTSADPSPPASVPSPESSVIAATKPSNHPSGALKLILQSKTTGQRLPGVRIKHRAQRLDDWDVKMLRANRIGEIIIPVDPDNLRMLQLITQIDGYADTRLQWHPDQGDSIPSELTVSLGPATRIGGQVIDPNGLPISGAKVGFNHEDIPSIRTRPLSHEFAWIEVETDDEGYWEINRLSNDILPLIYGRARHSAFVSSSFQFTSRDRQFLSQLQSGKHQFTLGSTMTITGIVTDTLGQPIPDTDVRLGTIGSGTGSTTTTDLEGRFVLSSCPPGPGLLTARADQLAPVTLKIHINEDQQEFQITLKKGRRSILKIQDPHGHPIAGARVSYDTYEEIDLFPSNSPATPLAPLPAVQVEFMDHSDAEGRVIWQHAPNQALWFSVSAKGFMRSDHIVPRPDDRQHVLTLKPALSVTGTIVDESTNEPIPSVRMITGWTDPHHNAGTAPPKWSTAGRFQLDFKGGSFHHIFEEPVVVGIPNPGYILKFTAPGYVPFVSRRIEPNEGTANLQIKLKRSEQIPITVLQPDGLPAALANIAFLSPGSRVNVVPGGLSFAASGQYGTQRFTDPKGKHRLNPDPARTHIVIGHQEGFKVIRIDQLQAAEVIQLDPWGSLEVLAAPPSTLSLAYGQDNHEPIILDLEKYAAQTSADGSLHFPKIPPGTHRLQRRHPAPAPNTPWTSEFIQYVEILPGQTTQVSLQETVNDPPQ